MNVIILGSIYLLLINCRRFISLKYFYTERLGLSYVLNNFVCKIFIISSLYSTMVLGTCLYLKEDCGEAGSRLVKSTLKNLLN